MSALKFTDRTSLVSYLKNSDSGQMILQECIESALPLWLCSPEGQEWAEKITEDNGRPHVLITISGDGFIEVFADAKVGVKIVQTSEQAATAGTELGEGCKQLARNGLSLKWQRVWETGKVVATFMFKPLTLKDVAWRSTLMDLIGIKDETP